MAANGYKLKSSRYFQLHLVTVFGLELQLPEEYPPRLTPADILCETLFLFLKDLRLRSGSW